MPGPDTPDDLTLLIQAAHEAGDIACRHFKSNPQVWDKGGDAGPVTEADLAVDQMLNATLRSARPDYGWLSEESDDDDVRLSRDHVFIIDPIDGTRAFIKGANHWAHSLAIAHEGQITAAVVFLPVLGRLYAAARGHGATLNDEPMNVSLRPGLADAIILSSKANFRPEFWATSPPPVERSFRPSLAYRMSLAAQGRFDAMITLRDTWEWDVAAGSLLVEEAGGKVTTQDGTRPSFNTPAGALPGLLAGTPSVVDDLLSYGPLLPYGSGN